MHCDALVRVLDRSKTGKGHPQADVMSAVRRSWIDPRARTSCVPHIEPPAQDAHASSRSSAPRTLTCQEESNLDRSKMTDQAGKSHAHQFATHRWALDRSKLKLSTAQATVLSQDLGSRQPLCRHFAHIERTTKSSSGTVRWTSPKSPGESSDQQKLLRIDAKI